MDNEPQLVSLGANTPPLPSEPKIYTMPGVNNQSSLPTPPPPPTPNTPSPTPIPIVNPDQPFNLKKLGSLFSQTIKTIWQKKWRFLYLNIIPKLLGFLLFCIPLAVMIIIFVIMVLTKGMPTANLGAVSTGEIIFIVLGVTSFLLMFFGFIYGSLWSQATYIYYLQTQEISKSAINKASRKKVWGLLWTTIISGFMAFGWFILFLIIAALWSIFVDHSAVSIIVLGIISVIVIIYSIIRSIRFSLAGIVKLVEGLPAVASVKRSKALIVGYSWPVFKRYIMLGYLQIIIQIVFSVAMMLVFWFSSVNKIFLIIAIIFGLAVFLFYILISFLLEPLSYAYYYDVYQNLSAIKNKDANAKEKHGFGYYLGIFGLLILLPLLWVSMFFLNLISNNRTADLSALSKLAPFLSGTGLNLNSLTNTNLENLDTNNQLNVSDINTSFDFLKTISDEDVKSLNDYSATLFKDLPGNPNKEDIPAFNAEELGQILNSAGFDVNKMMTEFSLEKQKFIWNSFYIGIASQANNTSTSEINNPANTSAADANLDSDNDGLTDLEEEIYGTNPNNPDSDGDSYKDGEEVLNGYNPLGPGELIK